MLITWWIWIGPLFVFIQLGIKSCRKFKFGPVFQLMCLLISKNCVTEKERNL